MNTLNDNLSNALQPQALTMPGIEGGPRFVLSTPEWAKIQVYANNAQALPTNVDQFRNSIHAAPDFDISDFGQLIDAYKLMWEHTTNWTNQVFPASVDLAGRIYQYGSQKVPVYYPALNDVIAKLITKPDDKDSQIQLKALLQSLSDTAKGFADEAEQVKRAIQAFAEETNKDKITMIGVDGQSGLRKYYVDKHGAMSAEAKDLLDEICRQNEILDVAMEEYHKDVTIAATTPTYGWILFAGTIAAAIVAGVYGDRAVKALERGNAARAQIDGLEKKQKQAALLVTYIDTASNVSEKITKSLVEAIPVIEKIQGVWVAMSADLTRIVEIIDQDITQALPIIMSFGIDEAMRAWSAVAAAADTYRVNAFIQAQPGIDGASVEAHKVQVLLLGRAA